MKGGHGELISVLDHMTLEGSVVTSVKSAGKAGVGGGNDYRLLPVMHLCVRCSCSMVHACTCQLYSHLVSLTLFLLLSSPLLYHTGRDPTAPLRIPVLDRYYDKGTVIIGKVESGMVSKGDEIKLMPTGLTTRVRLNPRVVSYTRS